jgi:hypothetical protein
MVMVTAVVIVANGPYLLGFFDPNPLLSVSGIAANDTPGLLAGVSAIDPNIGFTAQALGHRAVLDWLSGHIPWWNPYEGLGAPLAGEMQSAAFFPPILLLYFANGQMFLHILFESTAGICTFFLLSRFVRHQWIAVVGGIAFALNGTFSWFGHAPVNPIAFLPMLVLGLEKTLDYARSNRAGGWWLIAISLALSIYAGFPEVAFINGLLVAIWCLVRILTLERNVRRSALRRVATGVAVGSMLAAPILVAFIDYLPRANVGSHAGAFAFAKFNSADLPQVVLPYIFGPLFAFNSSDHSGILSQLWGGGYASLLIVGLAAVGCIGRRYRPLRLALAVWIFLAVGKAFGQPLITHALNLIPGIKNTAFPVYASTSWEFALIVLAVLGIDDLFDRERRLTRAAVLGLVGVVFVLLIVKADPLISSLEKVPTEHLWAVASIAWGAVSLLGIVIAVFSSSRVRCFLLASLIVVDALGLFVVPEFSAPRTGIVDLGPISYLQRHLGLNRFYTLGPIQPNYGSYFGIASVNVNDIPVPKTFTKAIVQDLDANVNPLVFTGTTQVDARGPTPEQELLLHLNSYSAMGVAYIVTGAGTNLPSVDGAIRLTRVFGDGHAQIYRLSKTTLYFKTAKPCLLQAVDWTSVRATCERPTAMTRLELEMPGWSATVDGKPAAVHEADHLFQSVELPRGTSVTTFHYSPPYLGPAVIAFALGAIVLVASLVRRRRTGSMELNDESDHEHHNLIQGGV